MNPFVRITCALFCMLCVPLSARACPLVSDLPDFNCDGEIVISVVGDSIVYGTEDSENQGKGGYVLRSQNALPGVTFYNFGIPGVTTNSLTSRIHKAFGRTGGSRVADALVRSDLIVIDVGRNDEWSKTPTETAGALKRLRTEIETSVSEVTDYKPLVVTAVLMVTKKIKKGAWIADLNKYIVSSDSKSAPADLRFDSVPVQLCGEDRIHPTSRGYQRLAGILTKYITRSYPEHVEALRKDRDSDGLYDLFETSKFGTDPFNPDTDGDGQLDGIDPYPLLP